MGLRRFSKHCLTSSWVCWAYVALGTLLYAHSLGIILLAFDSIFSSHVRYWAFWGGQLLLLPTYGVFYYLVAQVCMRGGWIWSWHKFLLHWRSPTGLLYYFLTFPAHIWATCILEEKAPWLFLAFVDGFSPWYWICTWYWPLVLKLYMVLAISILEHISLAHGILIIWLY